MAEHTDNIERIEVRLVSGPLPPAEPWHPLGAGAVVSFEGVVRPTEAGRALAALDYEQYAPMTERELCTLADEIVQRHGLSAIRVEHSVGRVAAGGCSFRLSVASAHRAEALQAVGAFIDRMKREVPLWKLPRYADDVPATESGKNDSSPASDAAATDPASAETRP